MYSPTSLKAKLAKSALAFLVSCPALAQTGPSAERPNVTIWATQSQLPVEIPRVGATVTVIGEGQIREQGNSTVADVLRRVPGLNVSTSGTRGTLTQVRIRGAEANHTLVLIDGVAVNSPDNGDFDFSQLPVDDIERIEVLRGPQSGIFGANAHAGVVVIQTKGARGLRGPVASAQAEGGSFRSGAMNARLASGNGIVYGQVSGSYATTDGTNIARSGVEPDGSRVGSIALQLGADISPMLNVEGRLRVLRRNAHSDPQSFVSGLVFDRTGDVGRRQDIIGSAAATLRLLDGAIASRTFIDGIESRFDFYTPAAGSPIVPLNSSSVSTRNTIGNRTTWHVPRIDVIAARQSVTVLAEHTRETFFNQTFGAFGRVFDTGRANTGLGTEYRIDFDWGLSLSASVRNDWNQTFDDALTWRTTAAYTFAPTGTTVRASAGRGVTNPTFYEQFGFFPNRFIGNPNVKPESSIGIDIGIRQPLFDNRVFFDATYFEADLRDVITTTSLAGGLTSVANIPGVTRRRGFELTAGITPVPWLDLTASYTYVHTADAGGLRLIRRPTHTWTAEAVARVFDDRLTIAGGVVHVGSRDDLFFGTFPARRIRLDPYTLVNARVAYRINENAEVYLRGENLLNQRYEDVFSYVAAGAAVFAGVRVKLGE